MAETADGAGALRVAGLPLDAPLDALLERLARRRGIKWSRHGGGVVAAWVADMDFDPPEAVLDALVERVRRADLGYPDADAVQRLQRAYAAWGARRHGVRVDPDALLVTGGVVHALRVAIERLTDPGDAVVVPTPAYPPFFELAASGGRRVVEHPLVAEAGYGHDLERLRDQLRRTRARAILLCNPHNPTGRAYAGEEVAALVDLALEEGAVVLADEIHADLILPGARHVPTLALAEERPERADAVVAFVAPSKTFNIAGLSTSLVVPGSARLRARLVEGGEEVFGPVGALGLLAGATAYEAGAAWLDAVLAELGARRASLAATLRSRLPLARFAAPEATYLAWIDLRNYGLGDDPAAVLLERARVALSPGPSFGSVGAGFVRLNFATAGAVLAEVLERVARAVEDLRTGPAGGGWEGAGRSGARGEAQRP
jgi:cystathionine beta-lyase